VALVNDNEGRIYKNLARAATPTRPEKEGFAALQTSQSEATAQFLYLRGGGTAFPNILRA